MNESNYRPKDCRTCQNMSCRVEQYVLVILIMILKMIKQL